MALVSGGNNKELSREQIARVRDIEYMLLDDIAESLLDKRG